MRVSPQLPYSLFISGLLLSVIFTGCTDPSHPSERLILKDLYDDPLPPYAVARLGTVRYLPSDSVWAIAISPDGRFLATGSIPGSESSEVELWDALTGEKLETPLDGMHNIIGLAWSPDSRRLAIGNSYQVDIWNRETRRVERSMDSASDGKCGTWSLAFSSDGKLLAGYASDNRVFVWNAVTGKIVGQEQFRAQVQSVAFSPETNHIIVTSGKSIQICSVAQQLIPARTIEVDALSALSGRLSPDRTRLATTVQTNESPLKYRVQLWNVERGELIAQSPEFEGGHADAHFSSEGKSIVSVAWGDRARIWDADTLEMKRELDQHAPLGRYTAVAADESLLATADRRITVCRLPSGEVLSDRPSHNGMIRDIAIDSEQKRLLSIASDGFLRMWQLPSGKHLTAVESTDHGFDSLALSRDGKRLATGHSDGMIRIRDPSSGDVQFSIGKHDTIDHKLPNEATESINSVAALCFSPDDSHLYSGGIDHSLRTWSLEARKQVASRSREGSFPELGFSRIQVSPDGNLLVSSGGDMSVELWDLQANAPLREVPHSHSMFWAPFDLSKDGACLVVSGVDQEARAQFRPGNAVPLSIVRLIETKSKKEIWRSDVGPFVTALAYSPDGRTVASAHFDPPFEVRVWSAKDGQLLATLNGHNDVVRCLAFIDDGSLLISGGQDTNMLVWDVNAILEDAQSRDK